MGGIRGRLTLWYVLLLFLTLLFFSAVVYVGVDRSLRQWFDNDLAQEVQQFARESELEDDGELDLEYEVLSHGEEVAVYDPQGMLVAEVGGLAPPGPVRLETGFDTHFKSGVPWRRLTIYAPSVELWVRVSRSQEDVRASLRALFGLLLVGVPLTVLLAGAGGLFLASRLLNPLDEITSKAATLGAEGLSERLQPLESDDELARLVETFNQMLGRLDEAFARQKQFTSDAAHELRTPIARLLTRAEVALSRPRESAEYQASLEEIRQGLESMATLVAKLLTLARSDAGAVALEREPLDLAVLAADAVSSLEDDGAAVRWETCFASAPVLGDQTRLTELVLNLLENAVRHTPEGGAITVSTGQRNGQAELSVQDSGPGVPEDLRERIFERFYQAEASRHGQGAGLGLPICRSIVAQHGGEIFLQKEAGRRGAHFMVRLPLAKD